MPPLYRNRRIFKDTTAQYSFVLLLPACDPPIRNDGVRCSSHAKRHHFTKHFNMISSNCNSCLSERSAGAPPGHSQAAFRPVMTLVACGPRSNTFFVHRVLRSSPKRHPGGSTSQKSGLLPSWMFDSVMTTHSRELTQPARSDCPRPYTQSKLSMTTMRRAPVE